MSIVSAFTKGLGGVFWIAALASGVILALILLGIGIAAIVKLLFWAV